MTALLHTPATKRPIAWGTPIAYCVALVVIVAMLAPVVFIVIGRRASYIAESEAADYVAGYPICTDVSERFSNARSMSNDRRRSSGIALSIGS